MVVRRAAHALGFRYRLHRKDLPGTPDLVFPSLRKAIFVHGCFWHGHDCKKGRLPKSRLSYWAPKIERNMERDANAVNALVENGWQVLTLWQCQTTDAEVLEESLKGFLRPG